MTEDNGKNHLFVYASLHNDRLQEITMQWIVLTQTFYSPADSLDEPTYQFVYSSPVTTTHTDKIRQCTCIIYFCL